MKTNFILSSFFIFLSIVIISCKMETESRVISTTCTLEDASIVNYYLQNIDCNLYELNSSQELNVPKGTSTQDIEKQFPGFTARGFSQNGKTLNVFFDRNIINVELNLNGGTAPGSKLSFTGLYGTAIEETVVPEKRGYIFQGFYNQNKKLTGAFPPQSNTFTARWKQITRDAPEGFVFVQGGTVTGSKNYASSPATNTCQGVFVPNRTVTLSNFYIAKYEVTKKLYKSIMEDSTLNTLGISADPSYTTNSKNCAWRAPDEDEDLIPVEGLLWNDAVYFCNLLSQKEGLEPVYTITNTKVTSATTGNTSCKFLSTATVTIDLTKNGYRLPTEAEWEYAARGGDPDAEEFAWNFPTTYSDTYESSRNYDLNGICWYGQNGNMGSPVVCYEAGYAPHQVGLKQPNSLGLYDMAGNVSEYVNDGYGSLSSAPTSEKGTFTNPLVQKGNRHIVRGGHIFSDGKFVSVSYRGYYNADNISLRGNFMGFRLARSIPE